MEDGFVHASDFLPAAGPRTQLVRVCLALAIAKEEVFRRNESERLDQRGVKESGGVDAAQELRVGQKAPRDISAAKQDAADPAQMIQACVIEFHLSRRFAGRLRNFVKEFD